MTPEKKSSSATLTAVGAAGLLSMFAFVFYKDAKKMAETEEPAKVLFTSASTTQCGGPGSGGCTTWATGNVVSKQQKNNCEDGSRFFIDFSNAGPVQAGKTYDVTLASRYSSKTCVVRVHGPAVS